MRAGNDAWELLRSTLEQYLADQAPLQVLRGQLEALAGPVALAHLDGVFEIRSRSYLPAALVQMAYKLADSTVDATLRQEGARGAQGVAGRLGAMLAEAHVPTVADAFQNVGKNSIALNRGNEPHFDALLGWLNEATQAQLEACLRYASCRVAAMARPVVPLPELLPAQMTFARVLTLYRRLWVRGSAGVYEQFTVASLLHGLLEQHRLADYAVDTKPVTVADRSSGAAGDVQVKIGNRVLEAFEVTAASWADKLPGVLAKMREHDLPRMHVIAHVAGKQANVVEELLGLQADVSVIDLSEFAGAIVAALTKPHRAVALARMYELLDRVQGDVELTNAFVVELQQAGLTLDAG